MDETQPDVPDPFTEANLGSQGRVRPSAELTEGLNYRLIQGQRTDSKLVICNGYSYLLNKRDFTDAGTKVTFYMRCKHPSCTARAIIKNGMLTMKPDDGDVDALHQCKATEGQSQESIRKQELLSTMKRRAAREGSTYYVS